MKTKTPLHRIAALFALALLATFGAKHEAKAQLTNTNWIYNFGSSTGTFSTATNSTTFLPAPSAGGGEDRVRVGGGGGSFTMTNVSGFGSGSALVATAPTSTSVNKFSIYDWSDPGSAFSLSFDMRLTGGTNGAWLLFAGNGATFSNNNSFSTAESFLGMRFGYGTSGAITTSNRAGANWASLSSGISQSNNYSISIFGNNSSSNLTYIRNGLTYTNTINSFHFWVGTNLVGTNLAKAQLATGTSIDSFMFFGESSTGNLATIALDNFNYANYLVSEVLSGNFWAGAAAGGGSGIWTSSSTNWATGAGGAGRGGTQATLGALVFTNTAGTVDVGGPVTVNAGMQFATDGYTVRSNTITLAGANAAANTITTDASVGTAINSVLAGSTGMTKAGSGTLLLAGNNTFTGALNVHDGTLEIASINNNSANGPLGNSTNPVSLGKSGTANVSTLHYTGGTASTTKGFSMASDATAGVINVANSGTTLTVSGPITGSSGSGLTKTGIGRLSLSGSSSYNGATTVSAGDLNLSGGSIASSAVTVASGASLSGYGSVGAIGGAGAINPGNSPGILTTPQVNPSAGTDFNFEMTGTAPNYSDAANSVNDLIQITGGTPFSQALAAGNGINIYFSGAALFTGSTAVQYQGGFFTDQSASFASSISGATYNYYFANGSGSTIYNGANYYTKAQYETAVLSSNLMTITVTTVAQTANFGSGDINGQVMQVQVVPEPSTYALLGLSAVAFGAYRWRRRRRG